METRDRKLAFKEIKPLADWIKREAVRKRGEAWPALLKFVSARAGRTIIRSNLEKWFSGRMMPSFGMGLILIEARKHFVGK